VASFLPQNPHFTTSRIKTAAFIERRTAAGGAFSNPPEPASGACGLFAPAEIIFAGVKAVNSATSGRGDQIHTPGPRRRFNWPICPSRTVSGHVSSLQDCSGGRPGFLKYAQASDIPKFSSALLSKVSNNSVKSLQDVVAVAENLQMPGRFQVFTICGLHASVRLS
jgi:hypothetical protein